MHGLHLKTGVILVNRKTGSISKLSKWKKKIFKFVVVGWGWVWGFSNFSKRHNRGPSLKLATVANTSDLGYFSKV